MATPAGEKFLPDLARAFEAIDPAAPLSTRHFADACARVVPIFDHIGGVFVIAKHEFTGKLETVAAAAGRHALLDDLVAAGRADGSVVVKNSPARNLHRLLGSLAFISAIFQGLLAGKPLKDAVSDAYDATLSAIHSWVVRAGIKAGMLALPSREHFLAAIGETDESARASGEAFVAAADAVSASVSRLYAGVEVPKSDFTVKALWGS